ncbi:MAG: TlpA disulfide reductase family protein [Halapricum sp.]
MRRRTFLTSIGGAGVVGTAGCLGTGSLSGPDDGDTIDPVTVTTFDAPGSDAGEITVPQSGTVTVIDMFATWCGPCKPTIDRLATARDRLDVPATFVSVTSEVFDDSFGKDDAVAWWDEHGGPWTVGHDPDSTLMTRLGVTGLPTTVVTDAEGTVVWTHTGEPDAEWVVDAVRSAADRQEK